MLMKADAPRTHPCKLCGSEARLKFGLPHNKRTGFPIPDEPDDCWYYECTSCHFLFTPSLDDSDHTEIYDDTYWEKQDPDWYGRVGQTFRLVAIANELLGARFDQLEILDFGCGSGGFLERGRSDLALQVWGTDIISPKVGTEWFLPDLGDRKFDVIVACEVIEHLPDPRKIFDFIRKHLKSPGVFAFQTAYWDHTCLDRNWWYLGPQNGHISLYSPDGLTHVFESMGGVARRAWNEYSGLQAWKFEDPKPAPVALPAPDVVDQFANTKFLSRAEAPKTQACKLCGSSSQLKFGLPHNKRSGYPIPDEPDDCWYYECTSCHFLFTPSLDDKDHTEIYDETYWEKQDPDWYGRVGQAFRLVSLANELLCGRLDKLEILDFGCGSGGFLERGRSDLTLNVWGTDIIPPMVGKEWFLPDLGDRKFDVIIACEVIEHLPDPRKIFDFIRKHLKSPGVFAFQTAEWDPTCLDRDWWYLGPHNGHISLYSRAGLTHVFEDMGGVSRRAWNEYGGLQAWKFQDEMPKVAPEQSGWSFFGGKK